MKFYYLKCFFTLFLFSGLIYSENSPSQGLEKAIMCSACHGQDGISLNPEWPNLASQHKKYLVKELHDLKLGKNRNEPTMVGFLANLTNQDIEDIAAFYAAKPLAKVVENKKSLIRGEDIYKHGDMQKHITACIACHGPDGRGNEEAGFPSLSGQNPKYTLKQLQAFKDGTRTNDISSIMHMITERMSADDMEQVANYIFDLR